MKKMYIVDIAVPMPRSRYGHHGLQHRADHRERARGEHRLRDLRGSTNQRGAVRRELQRREQRRRQDQQADERERLGRVLRGTRGRSSGRRTGRNGSATMPDRLRITPRSSTLVDVQRVVEVERLERALAEQAEARARRTPTSTVRIVRIRLSRANAASIEIGAGLLVLDRPRRARPPSRTARAAAPS